MRLPRAPEIAVFVAEPETVVWKGGRTSASPMRNQSVHWIPAPGPATPAAAVAPIPSKPVNAVQSSVSPEEHKFATVLFPVNGSELTSTELDRLNDFGGKHVSAVQIDAHADSTGSTEYNQRLSERRGNAVATTLKKQGTPVSAITVRSHGEDEPVASNETSAGRAANRRVTVDVVKTMPEKEMINGAN
jgi:outer membrane protein OmpA-like peptidoglycan-associated protein